MIYLNCAATSLKRPPCVAQAVVEALGSLGSSSRGTSDSDLSAARGAYRCRSAIAALLGSSHPDRVIFASNATQALNTAIFGLVRAGDRVVTTVMEHNSVLRPLYALERERGIDLRIVGLDEAGALDYAALERAAAGARLVCCTHASNLTGAVADVGRVAAIAHAAGALCLVDASQTAGAYPVDMEGACIDVVCFTGHKALMGPTGTGGLVAAPGIDIKPLLYGGTGVFSDLKDQPPAWPEHLEAGTLNGHGLAGLAAGAEFLSSVGVERVHERLAGLRLRFVRGLADIPGMTVYGPAAGEHVATVAVNLAGCDSSALADALAWRYAVATRAGLHCAPLMHEALGTRDTGAVRFSFGYYTTEAEVDAALDALHDLADEDASPAARAASDGDGASRPAEAVGGGAR